MFGVLRTLLFTLVAISPVSLGAQAYYDRAPIDYAAAKVKGRYTAFLQQVEKREINIEGSDTEVLVQVLKGLDIPRASQILVFSKTSVQRELINPKVPRALYFNEMLYVGWIPGGDLEIVEYVPILGPVFYRIAPQQLRDLSLGLGSAQNYISRDPDCLSCHGAMFSGGVPGIFARSVATGVDGLPRLHLGSKLVGHGTPLDQRWGGYYVTGYSGDLKHLGNAFTDLGDQQIAQAPTLAALDMDLGTYPEQTSDVVALMLWEHQITVLNAFTQADYAVRRRMHQVAAMQELDGTQELTERMIRGEAQNVVDALLFYNEAKMPDGGVDGRSDFQEIFTLGDGDPESQRLRVLQLHSRLLKTRCSYLLLSPMFASLTQPLRLEVLKQIEQAVEDATATARYAYLTKTERQVIRQILDARFSDA